MSHPVPLKDHVFLSIDRTVIDEITTSDGFKLYLAPEWNFEWNVGIQGKIAALPRNYQGELNIGDSVAFSYRVVSERELPNTSEYFTEISEGSNDIKIWVNGKGEKLQKLGAWHGAITRIWTGKLFDKRGQFEVGCVGTERQVDKWLRKNFKFEKPETFTYTNLITLDGVDYWKCSLENVFAKLVDGKLVPVSDRLICEPIEIPVESRVLQEKGILKPDSAVAMRLYDRARLVAGGESMGFEQGDVVSFEEKYAELYELFGKKYFLIRERRINGRWEVEDDDPHHIMLN
jgi:co-chaperonin GroES (HSP10)